MYVYRQRKLALEGLEATITSLGASSMRHTKSDILFYLTSTVGYALMFVWDLSILSKPADMYG